MQAPILSCRACGSHLAATMVDLGLHPPSNSYLDGDESIAGEKRYPLRVKVCGNCKLMQLDYDVPPEELFSNYAYFSSYSSTWLEHAKTYCEMAMARFKLDRESLVVELASNDGYLLKHFVASGVPVLGIDPSDTVAAAAQKAGVSTMVRFFGNGLARELVTNGKQADLIVANNVLAHVPALNDFVAGIATLLKPQGTATLEFPHALKLIEQVEFDTIYHEHFSYFSLYAVEHLFHRHGLQIYDVDELRTHGGSLRLFATHTRPGLPETAALRKVRSDEDRAGLKDMQTYLNFSTQVDACRLTVSEFLSSAKAQGKVVAGYGAAAKGNTFLNYCGLTKNDIPLVADRNPHKQGKLLPGSHIPVVSPEVLFAARPDYVLILPWNLKSEIEKELLEIRAWGGQFVTAVPTVNIRE